MSTTPAFDTPVMLSGPWREPRQMLADQLYSDHPSIHDEAIAHDLGFTGALIEGPTHLSQLVPLLVTAWQGAWMESGCVSIHFQNACVEGEAVQARLELPHHGADHARVDAAKADGTPVLTGSASVGVSAPPSELTTRLVGLKPIERPFLLDALQVGMRFPPETARIGFDERLSDLYPFSLAQKLARITEPLRWYERDAGRASPWGRPVLPLEMTSVLTAYTSEGVYPVRQPSIALYTDFEARFHAGPLFPDEQYELQREIVGLTETRRTEAYWIRTDVRSTAGELVADTLLSVAVLKESHPDYPADSPADSPA